MKRRPRIVPVHVSGWEIGCCVPEPGVGDEVSWSLIFHSPAEPDPRVLDDLGVLTRRWRVERNGRQIRVVDGPVVARLSSFGGPPPAPGAVEVTGILVTDFHGGSMLDEPVRARIRRVRVLSELHELSDGFRVPVAGSGWAYDVERSPRYLACRLPEAGEPRRSEPGVLVDLEV